MAELADIQTAVEILLSSSSTLVSDAGYESAINSALSELGWVLPETDSTRIMWITKRALRHCCFILWVASAQKFKYNQINLQHRFDHYEKLVASMDIEFENALTDSMEVFAGIESYLLFGTSLNNGFRYDYIGRDLTYDDLTLYLNLGD
jgi:hypothetical protein